MNAKKPFEVGDVVYIVTFDKISISKVVAKKKYKVSSKITLEDKSEWTEHGYRWKAKKGGFYSGHLSYPSPELDLQRLRNKVRHALFFIEKNQKELSEDSLDSILTVYHDLKILIDNRDKIT